MRLLYFFMFVCVSAIKPNNLPSGQPKKYWSNKKNKAYDLKTISYSHASVITKHWLNNILNFKKICKEDEHIVERINKLEAYIQEHRSFTDMYLAWMPQGVMKDVLFIVVNKIDPFNKNVKVMMVIQSPLWEPTQIESEELKESLEALAASTNSTLDLSYLYQTDSRYKLAWKNWT